MVAAEGLSNGSGAIYIHSNAARTPKRLSATRCVRLSSVSLVRCLDHVPEEYCYNGMLKLIDFQAVRRSYMCGPSLIFNELYGSITKHSQQHQASMSALDKPW